MKEAPVRLCCGNRHIGPRCPDGKVMCAVCFARVIVADLNTLPDGTKEDVCAGCAAAENAR